MDLAYMFCQQSLGMYELEKQQAAGTGMNDWWQAEWSYNTVHAEWAAHKKWFTVNSGAINKEISCDTARRGSLAGFELAVEEPRENQSPKAAQEYWSHPEVSSSLSRNDLIFHEKTFFTSPIKLIPRALGRKQGYTQEEVPVYSRAPWAHIHSRFHACFGKLGGNWRRQSKPTWTQGKTWESPCRW